MPAVMAGMTFWNPSAQTDLPQGCNYVEEDEGDEIWFEVDSTERSLVTRKVRTGGESFEPPAPSSRPAPPLKDMSKVFEKKLGFSREFLQQLAEQAEALRPRAKPQETSTHHIQKIETENDDDGDQDCLGASAAAEKSVEINKFKEFLNRPDPRIKALAAQSKIEAASSSSQSDNWEDNTPLEKFSKSKARSSSAMYTDYRLQEGRADLHVWSNNPRENNLNRPKKNLFHNKLSWDQKLSNNSDNNPQDYSHLGAKPRAPKYSQPSRRHD